jgi:hypothetical protein
MAGEPEAGGKNFEIWCGVIIALLAAVLAVTDLGAGKFGDDELIAHNEKSSAYIWYQSKGIKETLAEGQRDTLQALVAAGSIRPEQLPAVQGLIGKLDARVTRYGKEKAEILEGSAKVGPANWAQEVNGEKGKVIGALEWEAQAQGLGAAGDTFDLADLFLQLCLVLGAISLVVQRAGVRRSFFLGMIVLGLVGAVFSALAFHQAFGVG